MEKLPVSLHEIPEEVLASLETTIIPAELLPAGQAEDEDDPRLVVISDDAELQSGDGSVSGSLPNTFILNTLLLARGNWLDKDQMRDYGKSVGNDVTFKRRLDATSLLLQQVTRLDTPLERTDKQHYQLRLCPNIIFIDQRAQHTLDRYRKRADFYFENLEDAGDRRPTYSNPKIRREIFASMLKDFKDMPAANNRQWRTWRTKNDQPLPPDILQENFARIDTALAAYLCHSRDGQAEVAAIAQGLEAFHAVSRSIEGHISRLVSYFIRTYPGKADDFRQAARNDCLGVVLEADTRTEPQILNYFYERIQTTTRGVILHCINEIAEHELCLQPRQVRMYRLVQRICNELLVQHGHANILSIQEQVKEQHGLFLSLPDIAQYKALAEKRFSPRLSLEDDEDDRRALINTIPDENAEAAFDYELDKICIEEAMELIFGRESPLSEVEKITLSLKFGVFSSSLACAELTPKANSRSDRSKVFTYPSSVTDFYALLPKEGDITYKSLAKVASGLTLAGIHLAVRRALAKAKTVIEADETLAAVLKTI